MTESISSYPGEGQLLARSQSLKIDLKIWRRETAIQEVKVDLAVSNARPSDIMKTSHR